MKTVLSTLVLISLFTVTAFAEVQPGPVVIRSEPLCASQLVDPNITEVRVTFDRQMIDGQWSWTDAGAQFPKITGDPRYLADGRTCVLPVELEANATYRIGVNYGDAANFADRSGLAALPWVLSFTTGGAEDLGGSPELQVAGEIAELLVAKRFDAVYAHFNKQMAEAVDVPGLADVWAQVEGEVGTAALSLSDSFPDQMQDHDAIGFLVLADGSPAYRLQIVLDGELKVAGMLVLPE